MCIYILHISHQVSWRFTILLSEIGRQLVNKTFYNRYVKGVPFFNKRYIKGVPFLPKWYMKG